MLRHNWTYSVCTLNILIIYVKLISRGASTHTHSHTVASLFEGLHLVVFGVGRGERIPLINYSQGPMKREGIPDHMMKSGIVFHLTTRD